MEINHYFHAVFSQIFLSFAIIFGTDACNRYFSEGITLVETNISFIFMQSADSINMKDAKWIRKHGNKKHNQKMMTNASLGISRNSSFQDHLKKTCHKSKTYDGS